MDPQEVGVEHAGWSYQALRREQDSDLHNSVMNPLIPHEGLCLRNITFPSTNKE
jgi:hypothetical protein